LAHHTHASPHSCCVAKSLLSLHAVQKQKPELGLNHVKPVISFQRLSCLSEKWRVSGREVPIGGGTLSMVVPSPVACTSWSGVGQELPLQLSLLIPRLKDGGNSLGQGRWRGWVPVWQIRLRITPTVASVHHSVIHMSYR
jgi:hypothetical protein